MTTEERVRHEAECRRQIDILTEAMASSDSPIKRSLYEGRIKTFQYLLDCLAQEAHTIDVDFSDSSEARSR